MYLQRKNVTKLSHAYIYNLHCGTDMSTTSTVLEPSIGSDTEFWYRCQCIPNFDQGVMCGKSLAVWSKTGGETAAAAAAAGSFTANLLIMQLLMFEKKKKPCQIWRSYVNSDSHTLTPAKVDGHHSLAVHNSVSEGQLL